MPSADGWGNTPWGGEAAAGQTIADFGPVGWGNQPDTSNTARQRKPMHGGLLQGADPGAGVYAPNARATVKGSDHR